MTRLSQVQPLTVNLDVFFLTSRVLLYSKLALALVV